MFSRDILSFVNRELVVISTLATLDGTQNQLNSHLKICKNLGLTNSEFEEFFKILETSLSYEKAKNAREVFEKI